MSFSPNCLTPEAFDRLGQSFSRAVEQVLGNEHDLQSRELLGQILGYMPGRDYNTQGLNNAYQRSRLWFLLSSQMKAGIPIFEAVGSIRSQRSAMGFPDSFDEVLDDWLGMIGRGEKHKKFFIRHVLPVDLKQAMRLIINSQLGSFQDAMTVEADKSSMVRGAR